MLSTTAAAAVVMGMVIGAGIFRTPQLVAQSLGGEGALMLAWGLGGIFALIGALCYAELAAAFPDTGGDYRFLREAFGADAAWLFAWSRFAVIFSASGALLAFVGIDYLAELVPMGPFTRALVAGGMVILLTALNLRGVQTGTRAQIAMVAMDVLALLA
ncbi:MAG: amino acid permease, partial [Novosphingobium sp.]|nr:amino acid permease [Novosphingobium sp.]